MQTVETSPWQPVSSTPMTNIVPRPHVPGKPITSKPPLPPPAPPKFDQECDSRERIYGDCGVFGESDPIYSAVVMPRSRSSASSSGGSAEPLYGMIKLPRSRSSIAATNLDPLCATCSLPRTRTSSHGGSAGMPGFGSLPRSRNSLAMPPTTNYATLDFQKSYSTAAISKQYSLYHDPEVIYGSAGSSGGTVTSQNSQEDYGVYGEAQFYGSAGSAGSGRSSWSGRARTLPRPKKKVTFQEFG